MNYESARKEFPVTEELIFFDHARVSPLPERVRKVVTGFVNDAPATERFITKPG